MIALARRARIAYWLALFAILITALPLPLAAGSGSPMRWELYGPGHGSEVDYFAWWCAENIVQTTEPFVGHPLQLEPWQLEFMGEALAVDATQRQVWSSVALIVSRKNGKTAMLAAYALYHLLTSDGNPEVLLAASSDKNARRLFDAVVRYIRANPRLENLVHIRDYQGEIVRRDGRGVIYRLAGDPTTLHGYNPSLVICDELHAWTHPSHRLVWTALTTAGGARTQSQVFTITTAGEASQRQSSILGRMIEQNEARGEIEEHPGLTISRNTAGRTLIYNYCATNAAGAALEDHNDVEALKLANPASWILPDGYLARQAANPELSPAEVLQFHGCVWAAGRTTWPPASVFPELSSPRASIDPELGVVLAFDGSYSRDSTAIVGATIEEIPYLWVEAVWERPAGDRAGKWRTPRREVMDAMEEAMERYDVRELAPDPPGWHREIEEWEESYGEVVQRFETSQPRRMGPACDDFEQGVLGPGVSQELEPGDVYDPFELNPELDEYDRPAELDHERGEPELTFDGSEVMVRHLNNCVPAKRAGFTVVTKDAPDSPRKIDVAVGSIIAYHRARWHFTNSSDDLYAIVVDPRPPSKPTRPGEPASRPLTPGSRR